MIIREAEKMALFDGVNILAVREAQDAGDSAEIARLLAPVVRPPHYVEGRQYEPADVIIDWDLSWACGNALKYLSRAGRKGDAVEDLRKAQWFIEREIRRLSESPSTESPR